MEIVVFNEDNFLQLLLSTPPPAPLSSLSRNISQVQWTLSIPGRSNNNLDAGRKNR